MKILVCLFMILLIIATVSAIWIDYYECIRLKNYALKRENDGLIKIQIRHLLHERWNGPSIGFCLKIHGFNLRIIIPVPQRLSQLILWVQKKEEKS